MIERGRTVNKREREKMKTWPSSIQHSLPVLDPAGHCASLSTDRKVQSADSQPWPQALLKYADEIRRRSSKTRVYVQAYTGCSINLPLFNAHLHLSAPQRIIQSGP